MLTSKLADIYIQSDFVSQSFCSTFWYWNWSSGGRKKGDECGVSWVLTNQPSKGRALARTEGPTCHQALGRSSGPLLLTHSDALTSLCYDALIHLGIMNAPLTTSLNKDGPLTQSLPMAGLPRPSLITVPCRVLKTSEIITSPKRCYTLLLCHKAWLYSLYRSV